MSPNELLCLFVKAVTDFLTAKERPFWEILIHVHMAIQSTVRIYRLKYVSF